MAGRIAGKVAVVTGAASGIGRAVVQRFRAEGARVVAVDMSARSLAESHPAGDDLLLLQQDIAAPDAATAIIGQAAARFGGLDVVINNAGICIYETVEQTSDATWDRTLAVNLSAMFRLCRAAVPALRKRGGGRIINTASIMAERPYASLIAYTSAKHGVAGLTKSLAVELGADRITANYILPGATVTGITQPLIDADRSLLDIYNRMSVLGRMARPEELAAAFLFLASDEAAFITGHGLAVDGGALLKM